MLPANCGDAGIVHSRSEGFGPDQKLSQQPPVKAGFADEMQAGAFHPGIQLVDRGAEGGRGLEHSWVGHEP